jgi:hypothetical protein
MKLTRRLAITLLGLLPLHAADLPTAESILDRYVAVTGGKAAYDGHRSEVVRGSIEIVAAGIKGTLVRYSSGGMSRMTMELPGIGAIDGGYRDGVGWQDSLLTGPRLVDGSELAESKKNATLHPEFRWRELYSKAETVAEETVNGEACYKIVMTAEGVSPESWFLSKDTGLIVKVATTTTSPQGTIAVDGIASDYKEFGGVRLPTKMISKLAGQEIVMTFDSFEYNTDIPTARFSLPEGVAALVKK